jgi:hypothetical protein
MQLVNGEESSPVVQGLTRSITVIACDKRKAFFKGATRRSNPYFPCGLMDCFASLAMTQMDRHA